MGCRLGFARLCNRLAGTFIVLAAACSQAHAATDPFAPGQTEFLVGVEAYHAGYYQAALDSFTEARRRGWSDPNLDFNVALSQYKLGLYGQAQAVLERLRTNPDYADMADYQLGLVAARQQREPAAREHFRRVAATARSPKLRALAQTALDRLSDAALAVTTPAPVSSYFSAGVGYDSNPVLLSDSSFPGQGADGYAEVLGAVNANLATREHSADSLHGDLYLREYFTDTDLSQRDLELRGTHALFGQTWRVELSLEGQASFVGSHNLQDVGGLGLAWYGNWQGFSLGAHYEGQRVAGGTGYTYLDGWRQLTGLDWSMPLARGRLRAGYLFEANQRTDLGVGQQFFSESPLRHGAWARLEQPLGERLAVDLHAGYRYSRYRDADLFFVGNDLVEQRRVEKLAQFGGTARLRFSPSWDALLGYDFSHNQSSVPGLNYSRHLASIGFEWLH